MSLSIIEKYDFIDEENVPPTNEIVERVFRMAQEKILHCKSISMLQTHLKSYFNDTSNRLNS